MGDDSIRALDLAYFALGAIRMALFLTSARPIHVKMAQLSGRRAGESC